MRISLPGALAAAVLVTGVLVAPAAVAAPGNDRAADVVDHWTAERLAAAQPRDLVVDQRGLGYERRPDGRLVPHGHGTPAAIAMPTAVPSAESEPQPAPRGKATTGDTTGPVVANMNPAQGSTIGTSHSFSATVTDTSGVKSVTFVVTNSAGRSSSFAATANGTTWSVTLQGFSEGKWSWTVRATDTRRNTTTSPRAYFSVITTPPSTGDSTPVTNAAWPGSGTVQSAAGRIYFEMPANRAQTSWSGYVCSGTVVTDTNDGQSVILTAAHCVYDDVHEVFARNVLFIPNQDGTTGAGTDQICANDPMGCWAPSYGVVDTDWTTRTFPDNIPWDYAYYVVPTTAAHQQGITATSDSLETAAGSLLVQFGAPVVNRTASTDDVTTALGYSYSDDPNFMYCAEDMTTEGADNWWLPNCGLSGGASGGPWVQPMADGAGPVVSVNSWGYTDQPGMAGPKLSGTSAKTLYDAINGGLTPTNRGVVLD